MIVFVDILKLLKEHGWTLYRLRKERQIGGGVIKRIQEKDSLSTNTIDTICRLCDCQPGDIMKYVKDDDTPGGEGERD